MHRLFLALLLLLALRPSPAAAGGGAGAPERARYLSTAPHQSHEIVRASTLFEVLTGVWRGRPDVAPESCKGRTLAPAPPFRLAAVLRLSAADLPRPGPGTPRTCERLPYHATAPPLPR